MSLRLQRIIRCGSTFDLNCLSLDLKWLLRLRCSHQLALNDHGCTYVQMADVAEIRHSIMENNL